MTYEQLKQKFQDFFNTFNGQSLEFVDASNLYQCVDLVVAWVDWLDIPTTSVAGHFYPREFFYDRTDISNAYFEYIENTKDFVPRTGDIVIWNFHIAVCNGIGDINTFQSFDQNCPAGAVCQIISHDYDGVIGFMRPIVTNSNINMEDRRCYWFDLINKVIWNKPHEQLSDKDINDFVSSYKSQLKRSGLWDGICIRAGLKGDSNQITVDQLFAEIQKKAPETIINKILAYINSLKSISS